MKTIKTLILFLFLCGIPKLHAQQDIVTSGGDATGSGGSASYSIGQTAYVTHTGSNGSAAQGLQQPFEFSTLSGEDFINISLEAAVYPNPMVSNITILVSDFSTNQLTYQLYNLSGKNIKQGKITASETLLDMQQCASSTYILQLLSNQKKIKIFKIIKN